MFNSAVVGIEASKYGNGELPFAFVVLNEKVNDNNITETLMTYCKEKLPQRDIPCYIHITSTLPLTNVGKIDYESLHTEAEKILASDSQVTDNLYKNYEDSLIIR